jgi:microsomal epoxide hydrolase
MLLIYALACSALATTVAAPPAFVTVSDGARIHYVEQRPVQSASDVVLLFVPGWMMPAAIWKHQLAGLGRNYHVIAVDPRSQGDSTGAADGNYPARRAQDLREVILKRDLRNVVLIAATGSVVDAAAYVQAFGTDRLAAVVFVHGVAGADYDRDTALNLLRWAQRFQTERRAQTESLVRSLFSRQPPPADDVRWLTEEALKMHTSSAIAAFVGSLTSDFRAALPKIDKPALIIVGESRWHDQYEAMRQAIPGARLQKIAGTGHAPYLEEPAAFNDALAKFVEEATSVSPGLPR